MPERAAHRAPALGRHVHLSFWTRPRPCPGDRLRDELGGARILGALHKALRAYPSNQDKGQRRARR